MSEVLFSVSLFFIFYFPFVCKDTIPASKTEKSHGIWNKSINYRAGTRGINFPCHRISCGAAARTRIACFVESHISWYIVSPENPDWERAVFQPLFMNSCVSIALISNNFFYYSFIFCRDGNRKRDFRCLESVGTREMSHHWHNYDDDW